MNYKNFLFFLSAFLFLIIVVFSKNFFPERVGDEKKNRSNIFFGEISLENLDTLEIKNKYAAISFRKRLDA